MVISCDWCSFSWRMWLTDEERRTGEISLNCPEGHLLVSLQGTNIYRNRFYLLDRDGRKVLTLLCNPYSRQISSELLFVEVANWVLYSKDGLNTELLRSIHAGEFSNMSRLDICIDYNPTAEQWATMHRLEDNNSYVVGKRESVGFFDLVNGDTRVFRNARQLSWGSKYSNVRWKLYNKSLEIYEPQKDGRNICKKPHIEHRWQQHDMDVSKVWRLEVSITCANKFAWRGHRLTLDHCNIYSQYAALFADLVGTRFQIRRNQGHADRSNDEPDNLFDFAAIARLEQRVTAGESAAGGMLTTLRSLVKSLYEGYPTNPAAVNAGIESAIKVVLQHGGMQSYFIAAYGCSFEEYSERLAVEYQRVTTHFGVPFSDYDASQI